MGHHHHEELGTGTLQSYWRLLSYAKPYWKMLTVGILCGMLVGGSLFVAMLFIPKLMSLAESNVGATARPTDRNVQEIVAALDKPGLSHDEQIAAVDSILHPQDDDPELTKLIKQAKKTIRDFHLPCEIVDNTVTVKYPVHYSFDIVGVDGKVAWQLFAIYSIVMIVAWLFKCLAKYLNGVLTRRAGAHVVADLRETLFSRLTNQSLAYYGNMDIGQMLSRCTNDTQALEDSVSHSIEELTSAPIQIIACIGAILIACKENNSYALAIILFVGMPLIFFPIRILGRKIRHIYRGSFAKIAMVISRMHETFSGIKVVKACHTETYEIELFHKSNLDYLRQIFRGIKLQQLMSPLMEFVSVFAILIFMIYAYSDGITITELMALLAPAFLAARPMRDFSKAIVMIQRSMAAADRFFEMLDDDWSLPEKADAREMGEFRDSIRLDHVSFNYGERDVLRDVSFEIKRGQTIAVVGETGSGKTTIANLIARFYDVTGGKVLIDGVDVRDYTIGSLRKNIGVVTQEPILFNTTIAANIAYGTPDATREEIIAAAKLANAHEFITGGHHSDGYDTVVGEKGFKLSGGEKQRVAIARAILHNPPILILDEATSALDTVTEKLVQQALNQVMANRTVFAIAHRLSTIRNADLILVLDKGDIVESGTHEELLKLNGIYRRLHDTQFSEK